ncbi:MAG TPA: helix-turn-helix domain-containing protein [Candidatus Ozemobacteraceae bacterium]|nr:helix-turn-helix domain-containing protein [Candidatus Ozemobacteraceae bacterium]
MSVTGEKTRAEYVARVNGVVDLIQKNLDKQLSLDAVAEEAGFSPFHFHRVFAGVVGEPLHAYVRRARLERAALELERMPDRSITEIALDYGFSSSANFSRAFKEAFGASAREFREARTHYPELARDILKRIEDGIRRSAEQTRRQLEEAARQAGRQPPPASLRSFPATSIAYLRHYGPYEEKHKTALFRRIRSWAEQHLPGSQHRYVGICYGDRGLLSADRRRYDAGVEIPENCVVEAPAARLEIAGGQVAVFSLQTASLMVCDAWTRMHRDWLPASGFVPDDRPCVELFPDGFPQTGTAFTLEVCQAIRPR